MPVSSILFGDCPLSLLVGTTSRKHLEEMNYVKAFWSFLLPYGVCACQYTCCGAIGGMAKIFATRHFDANTDIIVIGGFSFFQTFMLQGGLAWIISSSLLGAQVQGGSLNIFDYFGIGIWTIGIIFEAGSDLQLVRFKSNPDNHDKLLTTGFWKYSRHPNYFGDAACWWGFGLMSIAAGSYLSAVGAIVMTVLIIRVSGVALLEKSLRNDKHGYAAYARRTSAFIPLPPKE